jgi:hypothetical protein
VVHVTGSKGKYVAPNPSIKATNVGLKPSTKILLGDWPWQGNRSTTTTENAWHNNKGKRTEAMLFGDGHAEFYKFPDALPTTYDPNNIYW